MAHISCHASDLVPNTYPPPRPSVKDHGMISAYGKNLVMHQAFPQPRKMIESGDEFPVLNYKPTPHAPAQMERTMIESLLDPNLCVTPEKPTKPVKANFNPHKYMQAAEVTDDENDDSGNSEPVKSLKGSQKVRFDQKIDVRHLSPEGIVGCDIIEIDRRGDPCLEVSLLDHADSIHAEIEATDTCMQDPVIVNHLDNRLDHRKKQYHEHDDIFHEPNDQAQFINVPVSTSGNSVKTQSSETAHFKYSVSSCVAHGDAEDSKILKTALLQPKFHSTMQMCHEIQQLQDEELDMAASVEQKLKVSSAVESKINEKACSKVNLAGHQFPSLVSLEVQEEELLQTAAQVKVKPGLKSKPRRPEDTLGHEPDILEFFTTNLQKESASFTLHGMPDQTLGFQSADLSHAFDVYRHIRAWEKWS